MKKILAVLLAATTIFSLTACTSKPAEPSPSSAEPDASVASTPAPEAKVNKVIAGVVFQEDQFFKLLSAGYAAAAKDLGYEIKLANTVNDQAKETEFVNTYAAEKIAGIAISPLSVDVSVAPLQAAHEAGLKVSICNSQLEAFPFASAVFTSDDTAFCRQTGDVAAKFIKDNLGGKAKVGIVQFKTQVPEQSIARVKGFTDGLDAAGIDYEIVTDQDAWLQDMAVAKAGDMLSANPDINVIFCANEGGTVGTTMAVDNAGLAGKVFVFGTDSSEQIVDLLKSDKNILQAVTGQDPFAIGYNTVKALVEDIEGKAITGGGQKNIVPGVPLSRADVAGLDAFLADLKVKMG